MEAFSCYLHSRRHIGLLILLWCTKMADPEMTCSGTTKFQRVRCFREFGMDELDILEISRNSLHGCFRQCARNPLCRSLYLDARYDVCRTYRQRSANNSAITSLETRTYYLQYGAEADCDFVPEAECYLIVAGKKFMYAGRKTTTSAGETCQRWDVQTPHAHQFINPAEYPDAHLAVAENFCRNPDGIFFPWCYTTDPNVRWRTCGIPAC